MAVALTHGALVTRFPCRLARGERSWDQPAAGQVTGEEFSQFLAGVVIARGGLQLNAPVGRLPEKTGSC